MEVSISEPTGLPPGTLLSIRAGNTRRQAPIPLTEPLRFPNLPFNAKQFKVDIFKPLGSAKLDIAGQNELESYQVDIDLCDGLAHARTRLGLSVREVPNLCGKRAIELKQADRALRGQAPEGSRIPEPTQAPLDLSSIAQEKAHAPPAPPPAADTRGYAREHNIPNVVQEMLQYVLRERPESPYDVMADFLKRKATEVEQCVSMSGAEIPGAGMTMPTNQLHVDAAREESVPQTPRSVAASHITEMPDPDRLQLEAEHLALRAERAALLRELAELDAAATAAGFS
jgi:hypothetical protein